MELDDLLLVLLQFVAATFFVWLCQGDVLILLGFGSVEGRNAGGTEDVPLEREERIPAEITRALSELGFAPVGVYWESATLHHREFDEYIFANHTGDCFASVYQLFGDDTPRVAFFTAFTDGACVLTQNYEGGTAANEDTLQAGGLSRDAQEQDRAVEQRPPLAEVLAEHRHRLRRFTHSGHAPLPCRTVDEYLAGQQLYHQHPTVLRQFRAAILMTFPIKLAFLVLGPLIVGRAVGIGSPWPWAFLFVNCVCVGLFRRFGARLIAFADTQPQAAGRG